MNNGRLLPFKEITMKTIVVNKNIIDKATRMFSLEAGRYDNFLAKHHDDIFIKISQDDLRYLLCKVFELRQQLDIYIDNELNY